MAELLDQALSMLSVTLRLAVQAKKRSEQIEKGAGPWSMVVSGAIPSDLSVKLDEYNKSKVFLPPPPVPPSTPVAQQLTCSNSVYQTIDNFT